MGGDNDNRAGYVLCCVCCDTCDVLGNLKIYFYFYFACAGERISKVHDTISENYNR